MDNAKFIAAIAARQAQIAAEQAKIDPNSPGYCRTCKGECYGCWKSLDGSHWKIEQ